MGIGFKKLSIILFLSRGDLFCIVAHFAENFGQRKPKKWQLWLLDFILSQLK